MSTCARSDGDGIAGNLRHLLRQQAALDLARGIQVLLYARPFQGALMVTRILDRDTRL
jgi:hypothetical protein